ncbi:hypothetical protein [Kitasatospora sp. GP82]|uniref:hypothetical protein n=1 Tax=Kitasatospora sp. GP82 TaxID=3035089 RepID=UPI0024753E7B|nr:hypothetical protein [Kitasatospora sp. GP82]MDH6123911.1 alanine dehydrogenase [Kitasatospora sp. GP82]
MTKILFAKESDCEENPGGHDLRATLVPQDVRAYIANGFDVVIQRGLGEGIGYIDTQYEMEGATVEPYPSCYAGKDLVVKLKGPSASEIAQLSPGTTMFSMGHLYCFPERKRLLEQKNVRLIAMESVTLPQEPSEQYLAGIRAGGRVDHRALGPSPLVRIEDSADQDYVNGLLRALMRYGRSPLHVEYAKAGAVQHSSGDGSSDVRVTRFGSVLRATDGALVDLGADSATGHDGDGILLAEELGKPTRAIGQIREVGIGGAKYGLDLYRKLHGRREPKAVVLGYGNCSMGAFEHLRNESVEFTLLGRPQTAPAELPQWLRSARLIINGAETPGQTDYIITNANAEQDIEPGSVVIDLIGGSPYRRSPVEPFQWTTFLPEIHFESDGRYFAGLWGWDMYYSMHDTAKEYSRRIKNVLAQSGRYAKSLDDFVADYAYAQQLGA